jgi:hypothetical protein
MVRLQAFIAAIASPATSLPPPATDAADVFALYDTYERVKRDAACVDRGDLVWRVWQALRSPTLPRQVRHITSLRASAC